MSCPCKDSQHFYNSLHRLSNPTSGCWGRAIHKVVSYLKYVFGEDGYLNFDSLDYNALYCGTLYLSYEENFISVPSNKVRSRKNFACHSFYLSSIYLHRDQKSSKENIQIHWKICSVFVQNLCTMTCVWSNV